MPFFWKTTIMTSSGRRQNGAASLPFFSQTHCNGVTATSTEMTCLTVWGIENLYEKVLGNEHGRAIILIMFLPSTSRITAENAKLRKTHSVKNTTHTIVREETSTALNTSNGEIISFSRFLADLS